MAEGEPAAVLTRKNDAVELDFMSNILRRLFLAFWLQGQAYDVFDLSRKHGQYLSFTTPGSSLYL